MRLGAHASARGFDDLRSGSQSRAGYTGSIEAGGKKVDCLPVDRIEAEVVRLKLEVEMVVVLCDLVDKDLDDRPESLCVSDALGQLAG